MPMLVYFMYVLVGTICCIGSAGYLIHQGFTDSNGQSTSFKNGQLRSDTQNKAISIWNIARKIRRNESITGKSYILNRILSELVDNLQ